MNQDNTDNTVDAGIANPNRSIPVATGPTIGQPVDMVGARARVSGRVDFALNAVVPGMTHARLLRSPLPHARIRSIDTSAAEKLPGVVAVLTATDFDRPGAPARYYGAVLRDQPVLCGEKVRFAGDPVAAVAAETEEQAAAALLEIEVDYEPLPAVGSVAEALAEGAPLVHEKPPLPRENSYADIKFHGREGNVCTKFQLRSGDVDAGFAAADHIFDNTYESPAVQHLTMEPHVVLAHFEGERLTVTSSTQAPYAVRDTLAEMFGVAGSKVRVIVPPIGGGYGGKTYAKFEPVTAALAWKARRPVKLVLPRDEEFLSLTKHAARIRMRTGVSADGRLLARDVEVYFDAGAYTDISPRLIKNGGYSCAGPYSIPNVRIDSYAVYTNLPPAGAYRGYGVSQAAWAYEQQMDEMAAALGIDPVEFRRRNLLTTGDRFATGEIMREAHWRELLDRSAEAIDYDHDRRVVVDEHRVRGKGVAVILKSTITPSTSHAAMRLDADGSLQVLTSSVEMGQGAHTVLAQLAAQPLGLPLSAVHVTEPDTQYTPYDQTTSSSRTTRAMGGALTSAAHVIRDKLLQLAGDLLEVSPADLVLADGHVVAKGSPGVRLSVPEVFHRTRTGSISGDGEVITSGGLDPETGQGIASDHWHQGAAAAEVEVDLGTGKVYVRHVHSIAHAGRVVNPKLARLQMHGSTVFGISHALYEELLYDGGILTNPNLSDYSITAMGDMPPRLEVEFLEDEGEAEIHGLGETTLPPVIAAIGNAVRAAIGAPVRTLPITAERVLEARKA
ncbi:xanthine dehydrogenase family protein molybdopterin-binding subunit [Pseudonocardia sp. H11422]|uniref:xanthine dehydrogenase family protein molybdopterin-binding subunit n=1 Tax=Pseudonocardia sp. H11422 TaxID=2835866 RepID=UPI001BDC5C87|nr:xanthine dehydrogenase family protein molybdopterin-binding subunit [Pseudonocardia sp. H11422]